MRRIISGLAALIMVVGGLVLGSMPAEAAEGHTSKICQYWRSYTYVTATDIATGASNNLTPYDSNGDGLGECTGYHKAEDWRIDTDPTTASHSYRYRYDKYISGVWRIGGWNGCHTNSDNHSSNPQDPTDGTPWRVVIQNFDGGDCNDND